MPVRLLYDDMGCFLKLPKDYPEQLLAYGIQCQVFNPFRPVLSAMQNNRDHRKIAAIDSKVAFTGGINLADEYIDFIAEQTTETVILGTLCIMGMAILRIPYAPMVGTGVFFLQQITKDRPKLGTILFISRACRSRCGYSVFKIPRQAAS